MFLYNIVMKNWIKNIGTKIKNATYKFMYRRNGVDALSNFLLLSSFVALLPSLFITNNIRIIFVVLFWAIVIFSYFRIFSKNIYKRQQENTWFINKKNYYQTRFSQRKQYKFYDCPKCKTHLRIPKGVGKVTITCKKCGHQFDKKA